MEILEKMEYITLNNGVKMPMAGLGTFLLSPACYDFAEAYNAQGGNCTVVDLPKEAIFVKYVNSIISAGRRNIYIFRRLRYLWQPKTLCIHIVCIFITCRKYWKPVMKTE